MCPIYSYICEKCEKEIDRLVSFSNADEQLCDCEDGARLVREDKIHGATPFVLKGNWFKTRGTY